MKILHLIESLDPKYGGPSVSVPSLASAQAAHSHDVTIFTYKGDASLEELADRDKNVIGISKVKIIYFEKNGALEKIFANNSRKELVSLIEYCDILHIHGVWGRVLHVGASLAKKYNKKYIFTPRGMLDTWSLNQKRWKKKLALGLGLGRILSGSFFIHALNANEKSEIDKLALKCEVRIIPNGVNKEIFSNKTKPGLFYEKYRELNGRKYILFLSRLHYKKGIDYLADTMTQFISVNDNVDFVIAGPDDGELSFLNQYIKDNGLTSRVHMVGPLYGEDKVAAFVDALCFFLPSRQEGFSMAILESLGYATPVVITEGCNFPEVTEYNAGLVVNQDSSNMTLALLNIIDNQDKYTNNTTKLIKNYLWDKIAIDVINAYQ